MYEKLVRRVIWRAKCPNSDCEWEDTVDKNPPREKMCPNCKTWCKYEKLEYTGKDKFNE